MGWIGLDCIVSHLHVKKSGAPLKDFKDGPVARPDKSTSFSLGVLWVVVPISQASEKYAIANMPLSRSFAFAAALALAAIFLA